MAEGAKFKEQSPVIEGYHAVEEVRKVRDKLAAQMEGMSPEEQLEFLRRRAGQARQQRVERQKQ